MSMSVKPCFFVIGGAVADIMLCPVDASIFERDSTPIACIPMSTGGDALNEASVLARLGNQVALCTLLGEDDVGRFLFEKCRHIGIDTRLIVRDPDVTTSVNVVLVDSDGERRFVTAANSSLRRLGPEHVESFLENLPPDSIVSFASIFVSPCFGIREMGLLFSRIKARGCILCADMTRCKNGETAEDLREVIKHVDYLFMNADEGALLTGEKAPEKIASLLRTLGAKHVIVKLGKHGCYADCEELCGYFDAVPDCRVLDTTGAGDTFAGAFLHALGHSKSFVECLKFANAAAGICVEHRGCASECLAMAEIENRMRGRMK